MPDQTTGPSTRSSESQSMQEAWTLISDVLAGAKAVREKGELYLPKFENEGRLEYARRCKIAPWRPEFDDALRSLASKPFDKDVSIKGEASAKIKDFVEDVDGRGNSLTTFARESFGKGIGKGLHAVLVDYPTIEPATATIATERAAGLRPYWVQIEANDILALYTEWKNGREIVSHVRIRETTTERDGFGEVKVERVRIMEPGLWQLWEKRGSATEFSQIAHGAILRGGKHTGVPLVLFYTGERQGELAVKPPLADLAQLQIELYQALSRQDEILTFAGSPILSAEGMAPPTETDQAGNTVRVNVTVGPKSVLFTSPRTPGTTGPNPRWDYIQPEAANIKEIREHVASIIADMRRLGMQPLTPQSGRPTATGQSIDAAKAHSAVQAWAIGLKDALEQAMVFTAEWMGEPAIVEVSVWTDFNVLPYEKMPLDILATARAEGDLSRKTFWQGLQRFNALPADFDADAEEEALKEERANDQPPIPDPAITLDPATRLPVPKPPAAAPAA